MPFSNVIRIPDLKLHRGKNRMYVIVQGKFRYFGKPDDPATLQRYKDFVLEWKRTGSVPARATAAAAAAPGAPAGPTVGDIIQRFKHHPENAPIHSYMSIALRELESYCGALPASGLSPKTLKNMMTGLSARTDTLADGSLRGHFGHKTIRQILHCVKYCYRWAAAEELIDTSTWIGLSAVTIPRVNRSVARDPKRVMPVPAEVVQKTVAEMPPTLAAIVHLLNLTGARPSEILTLKAGDIERTDPNRTGPDAPCVWRAVLTEHKNAHRGMSRVLHFGPAAQAILAPFLFRPADEYLFKPIEALRQGRAECTGRHQPVLPPKTPRRVRDCYDAPALRHAIKRAAQKAQVKDWHPYQLRHACATRIRREMGLDAASKTLGHSGVDVTQVYAELSDSTARDVALRLG